MRIMQRTEDAVCRDDLLLMGEGHGRIGQVHLGGRQTTICQQKENGRPYLRFSPNFPKPLPEYSQSSPRTPMSEGQGADYLND